MQDSAAVLHVHLDSIDDNKRLCIGIQRVQTTYKERVSAICHSGTADRTDISTKICLDLIVQDNTSTSDLESFGCSIFSTIGVHGLELVAEHADMYLLIFVIALNGYLLCHITGSLYIK